MDGIGCEGVLEIRCVCLYSRGIRGYHGMSMGLDLLLTLWEKYEGGYSLSALDGNEV